MYFDRATRVISEIGAHGEGMSLEEYSRSDRPNRITAAATALCDFVFEHLMETEGNGEWGNTGAFTQAHMSRIAEMVAIGMMVQFEYDLEDQIKMYRAGQNAERPHATT